MMRGAHPLSNAASHHATTKLVRMPLFLLLALCVVGVWGDDYDKDDPFFKFLEVSKCSFLARQYLFARVVALTLSSIIFRHVQKAKSMW